MELYQNDDMFAELCSKMYEYYRQRSSKLKERDAKREQEFITILQKNDDEPCDASDDKDAGIPGIGAIFAEKRNSDAYC